MSSTATQELSLNVVEIFYSLQAEGANAGTPVIFVRLGECNLNCSWCDTEFNTFTSMTIAEIRDELAKYESKIILFTGGEPTLQLTNEVLEYFYDYELWIETNGTNPIPSLIGYVTISPKPQAKIHESILRCNEIRVPLLSIDKEPDILDYPHAENYFVSPIFLGEEKLRMEPDEQNTAMCYNFVMNNPPWRLSVQWHKLLNIR